MRFEWDENKRQANLKKHGIDFGDIWRVFENETYTKIDDRFVYSQIRYLTLGLQSGEVIAVSHTETDEVVRIIFAKKS